MDPRLLVRGAVVGFALAAPIGPIGIMVIRRSLEGGARSGLATGLGAAVGDALFALAGVLGLASLGAQPAWMRIGGAAMLCVLGVRAIVEKRRADAKVSRVGHARAFAGTLLYTLASPVSILSFAAVAATLGVARGGDAAALVLGVFVGSTAWWLVLSGGVAAVRRRVPDRAITWLSRAGGAALVAFGLASLGMR
ncbi:MAG TPA: LysE family transporter [Labilithrix sp.]|jgi:putative LysE/RhtB family amino acid efflux pump